MEGRSESYGLEPRAGKVLLDPHRNMTTLIGMSILAQHTVFFIRIRPEASARL